MLVVEDELLLALMLEDMLADFGCVVAGPAETVAKALSLIAATTDIDAAILDVHIGGEMVFPVADALRDRRVPFVFSTGFGPSDLATRYPGSPLLAKPYPPEALASTLARLRGADPGDAGHSPP
ncbi:response regulator [Caulobacter sp. LARHSG274]